ncbi:hypothetical protein MMC17_000548 [Xylographa soralifera]|nr:hypothetical protein [Xylographa soralifera]
MWPPKPLVPHKTALLGTSIYMTVLAFIFATLALVAGWRASVLENSAILTFDTTAVSGAVLIYLGSSSTPLFANASAPSSVSGGIRQWYSAHYLSVCKGDWAIASSAQPSGVKNLSTVSCEPRGGGYVFALADELARDAAPAAAGLFVGWEYDVLRTMGSVVPLAAGLGFVGLALVAVLHVGRYAVPVANVGFAVGGAVLLTVAAGVVTAQIRGVGGEGLEGLDVVVMAAGSRGFTAFVWIGAVLMMAVVPVNVALWRLTGKGMKGKRPSREWKGHDMELLPS